VPAFSDLARTFLDEEYAEAPSEASTLGLTAYDDQLEDLSEAAFKRRSRNTAAWLERFADFDSNTLSFDEQIDRDLVVARLRRRAIFDQWEVWRRHPDIYLHPGLEGCSPCSCIGSDRKLSWWKRLPPGCAPCPPTWPTASPTCGKSSCPPSCWIAP
jgi:hypothetical protein